MSNKHLPKPRKPGSVAEAVALLVAEHIRYRGTWRSGDQLEMCRVADAELRRRGIEGWRVLALVVWVGWDPSVEAHADGVRGSGRRQLAVWASREDVDDPWRMPHLRMDLP